MNKTKDKGKLSKETMISLFQKSSKGTNLYMTAFAEATPFMFVSQTIMPENLTKREIPLYTDLPTYKAAEILDQPFSLSGCGDITTREWYYVDEFRVVQGPFTTLEMDHWFASSFLYDQLLIKFTETGNLMKLEDFVIKVSRILTRDHQPKKKFSFNMGENKVESN